MTDGTHEDEIATQQQVPHEHVVMLPVNTATGEVDYDYIRYDLRTQEDVDTDEWKLISGWEYRRFKVILDTET